MPETCPYCAADLKFHCHPLKACGWVYCPDCGTVLDVHRHVARRGAESVDWPS